MITLIILVNAAVIILVAKMGYFAVIPILILLSVNMITTFMQSEVISSLEHTIAIKNNQIAVQKKQIEVHKETLDLLNSENRRRFLDGRYQ